MTSIKLFIGLYKSKLTDAQVGITNILQMYYIKRIPWWWLWNGRNM